MYDAEYMRYYTGLKPNIISSFAGFYMTGGNEIHLQQTEILIFKGKGKIFGFEIAEEFVKKVKESLHPEFTAEWVYTLYPFYTIQDLTKHPAVITLPYSVMSYRFTELYALAIPIYAPSPKFFLNYYDPGTKMFGLGWDRTSTNAPMCETDPELEGKMRPPIKRLHSNIT